MPKVHPKTRCTSQSAPYSSSSADRYPSTVNFHRLLIMVLWIVGAFSPIVSAQSQQVASVETAQQADESNTADKAQVDSLIRTLENPQRREAFLKQLRAMSDALQKSNQEQLTVSRVLDFSGVSREVIDRYQSTLSGIGLSESAATNLLLVLLSAVTLYILAVANRYLARKLDRRMQVVRTRFHLTEQRFTSIFRIQKTAGFLMAAALFIYSVGSIFELSGFASNGSSWGVSSIQLLFSLIITAIVAALVAELSIAVVEYTTSTSNRFSDSRAETLVPIVRNILLSVVSIIFVLMAMSEIGINILPLLAGAGVVGVALGFGAQALVKDFLTGFIVIFEDLFQVGDVVQVGQRTGLVEAISLRKVQLRDLEGIVHTVPFSDVSVVDNFTKEYSYYLFDIGVAYREDVDEVIACLRDVDEEMRDDDEFGDRILAPLEVLGVEAFADSAVVIRARTKTQRREQWNIGREFKRRIKIHFDRKGIEIPFPHQTLYFGQDKDGTAPSANIELVRSASEDSAADSQES